ncbi:hypothetical protein [Paenibacillus sp. 276b]|uniref:hypothetical protein n=1 Tax=Paenibacillus sp. 276b TaxID=1566277 RepID=UPI001C40AF2E|nr:hypothetical protein [Paenibacillus sp. 276b]
MKTLSVTNEFVIYSELDYYRDHSFLVRLEALFHLLPKAWKINVHQDHIETVALYRGDPFVRLLSSAFEGSPLSKKLNIEEIEQDDIVCTLWDIEPIRDILNMNNRKITLLIPRGITEEGLAVFSLDQDKWFREKFHVFWAMNRLKGYQSNDDF